MVLKAVSDRLYLSVVFSGSHTIARVYWPFFAAIPNNLPSYFPWVAVLGPNDDWKQILEPKPDKALELHPKYIKIAFAIRPNNWYKNGQSFQVATNTIPADDSIQIAKLDPVTIFQSERH